MRKQLKGESIMSLLVALMLLSIFILSFYQWKATQTRREELIYQKTQAILILSNYMVIKNAGGIPEKNIRQNGLEFNIVQDNRQIRVTFPLGEILVQEKKEMPQIKIEFEP